MRIANVDGRAVLLTTDTSGIDVAVASAGKFGPQLPSIYEDWDSFRAWADDQTDAPRGRALPARPARTARHRHRGRSSPSGSTTPRTRPSPASRHPTGLPPDVHQVRQQPRRPRLRGGAAARWPHRLGGRARGGDRAHGQGRRRGRRLGPRRRARGGAGPLRARLAAGRPRPAVQPRQVVPQLRARRPLAGHTRLRARPGRPRPRLRGRRRDRAGRTHQGPDRARSPGLVAELSRTLTLFPGDILFTGTPSGVGVGRTPQRFLQPGETLVSWIEGIGELHQTFVEDGATS